MIERHRNVLIKIKAILFPAVGLFHILFWKSLPNPVLAAVIAVASFAAGILNIAKWVESSSS